MNSLKILQWDSMNENEVTRVQNTFPLQRSFALAYQPKTETRIWYRVARVDIHVYHPNKMYQYPYLYIHIDNVYI